MPARTLTVVLAVLACAVGGAGDVIAQTSPQPAKTGPAGATPATPIEFYLAHGEADACGPGCSEWIAAEGKIDAGAADRFRQLLKTVKDRRPPVFFHSPGGRLVDALELGRILRERKFEVNVGHTMPLGCGSDKQAENSCQTRRRSGQVVAAEISPTVFQCNSACVYALAGGAVRLVPPGVKLGIHDAGFDPDARLPRNASLPMALRAIHTRIRSYLREMGIDDALYSATLATPFASVRLLQREELVSFGIDRREFGETEWQFVDGSTAEIRKRFFVRIDGDQPHYVDGVIELGCSAGRGSVLILARQLLGSDTEASTAPSSASSAISITIKGRQITLSRTITSTRYFRTGLVAFDALDLVNDDDVIELPGTELGRQERGNITLKMEGFSTAYAKLRPRCSAEARAPKTVSVADTQAAMRVVSQLPHTKEVVSDPKTAAWLLEVSRSAAGKQAATAPNSANAKGDGFETLELSRVAAVEQRLRVDFLNYVWADCSSSPVVTLIITRPQHGEVTMQSGQDFPDIPKDDQRATCNTRKTNGTFVFYQPNADYRGADSFTLRVLSASGHPVKRHYSIEVR